MRTGRITASLGLATGLLLALAGPSAAATNGDAVTAKQPYPLKDATRFVVQGRPDRVSASSGDTRCLLPRASLSLAPHERAIELRQVALNLRTCRVTYERGVPPKSTAPDAGQSQTAGARRAGGADGGVQALANGYRYSGYSKAWYRDARNGRMVNSVASGADWNTTGACIGANNVWFSNTAHTSSGWFEVSHAWRYLNNSCDSVVSSTDGHFRDRSFRGCSGGPRVDTFYSRVRFFGYPNGSLKGSRSSRVEPSCKNVLIAYFALYRR